MAKVYGIDLGTTYSVIANLDENGTPEVIENYADSVQLLASAVYFPSGENRWSEKRQKIKQKSNPTGWFSLSKEKSVKPTRR